MEEDWNINIFVFEKMTSHYLKQKIALPKCMART